MSATRSEMEGFARDCMMLALSTTDPVARERLLQMARSARRRNHPFCDGRDPNRRDELIRLAHTFLELANGGGTNIATEAVVNASPDGYTLLLVGLPNASNASLYESHFHPRHRSGCGASPVDPAMVVSAFVPAYTVPEF